MNDATATRDAMTVLPDSAVRRCRSFGKISKMSPMRAVVAG